jgi:hypothetical protein
MIDEVRKALDSIDDKIKNIEHRAMLKAEKLFHEQALAFHQSRLTEIEAELNASGD